MTRRGMERAFAVAQPGGTRPPTNRDEEKKEKTKEEKYNIR